MNKRIIDILIKNDSFSEEINTYNKIDEFLKKEEVIYDGNVISAYELDKILYEKMSYIRNLSNPSNYDVLEEEFLNMLKRVHLFDAKDDEEIEKIDIGLSDVKYGFFSYWRSTKQSFAQYLFSISTNNSNRLLFSIFKCFDQDILYRDIVAVFSDIWKFYTKEIYDSYYCEYISDYINKFILENKEILDKLFLAIQDIYSDTNKPNFYYATSFSDNIKSDDWNLKFVFDLINNNSCCNLSYISDEKFSDNYIKEKKRDILKRISINIDDLNPFFKNEIDKYYNSINYMDYKSYRRKN